jgi:ribosomal protein S18 acetylase RimI-like enzyme
VTVADILLRPARDDDAQFLGSMLYEAAFWRGAQGRPPREEVLREPDLRVYLEDWGRPGDRGLVAMAGAQAVGAAWYRLFPPHAAGYGFVDTTTPELTVAVTVPYRGRGIGRALLSGLLHEAVHEGVPALSLSVESDNPAVDLYRSLGFETIADSGDARTMLWVPRSMGA